MIGELVSYSPVYDTIQTTTTHSESLIPVRGQFEEERVYQVGAKKHGANSWRQGVKWSTAVAKILRHLGRFLSGESYCPVDGQHHLASVKFWCNALIEYEHTHPELDDVRSKEVK